MVGTSLLHQPERLRSFERELRRLWQITNLQKVPLMVGGQRLHVVRLLGHGASAVVCEAKDSKWTSSFAVKLFPWAGEEGFEAVRKEAKSLAGLRHENIVAVKDFDRADIEPGKVQCYWLSMELVEGVSLRAWLGPKREDAEILGVMRKVGDGLAFAHAKNVVHRDLKPENIMLTANCVPKIVDFGLAVANEAEPDAGIVVGTPAFMAPEALRGERPDKRSDQFSFAATLWLALCRDFPYDPASRDPDKRGPFRDPPERLSPALVSCLRRALDPIPSNRFPTMNALIAALEAAELEQDHAPSPAPSPVSAVLPSDGVDSEVYVQHGFASASVSFPEVAAPELVQVPVRRRTRARLLPALFGCAAVAGILAVSLRADQAVLLADEAEAPELAEVALPPAEPQTPTRTPTPTPDPLHVGLAPPPTCAVPAAVVGHWSFATAVTRATQRQLTDRIGEYGLEISLDLPRCALRAKLRKLRTDEVVYDPPLTDEAALEFTAVPGLNGRLVGEFTPHIPWAVGAYTYAFTFLLDGDELYGGFRARGGERFTGLLRGHRAPRPAPTAAARIRERQPCLAACEAGCTGSCATRCAPESPWAAPNCPNP